MGAPHPLPQPPSSSLMGRKVWVGSEYLTHFLTTLYRNSFMIFHTYCRKNKQVNFFSLTVYTVHSRKTPDSDLAGQPDTGFPVFGKSNIRLSGRIAGYLNDIIFVHIRLKGSIMVNKFHSFFSMDLHIFL